jgi:hypothetical protein
MRFSMSDPEIVLAAAWWPDGAVAGTDVFHRSSAHPCKLCVLQANIGTALQRCLQDVHYER